MNNEQMVVNAIRILSAEAVQKAKSGHPGMPMGSAAMAYAVWGKQMKHNPADPQVEGSRPFRAVLRPWLHADVQPFTPLRLRPDH